MEITCLHMDVLISFYIDGDLSENLKNKVEEHIKKCSVCRAKYNIISSIFTDLRKNTTDKKHEEVCSANKHQSKQYQFFKKNLSAYVDNELSEEDNMKIRKYTIGNKYARKELEDTYHIRKLIKDSYSKSKSESTPDFSKKVLKRLNPDIKNEYKFNTLISVAFAFIMSVLFISAVVIYFLTI